MAEVGTITQKRMPRLNQNVSGAPVPWKICAVKDESRKRGRKVKTRPKVRRTNFAADTPVTFHPSNSKFHTIFVGKNSNAKDERG